MIVQITLSTPIKHASFASSFTLPQLEDFIALFYDMGYGREDLFTPTWGNGQVGFRPVEIVAPVREPRVIHGGLGDSEKDAEWFDSYGVRIRFNGEEWQYLDGEWFTSCRLHIDYYPYKEAVE